LWWVSPLSDPEKKTHINPESTFISMKYESKSVLIARRKVKGRDKMPYDVDIKLFDVNDPHKTTSFPTQTIEFPEAERVTIIGFKVDYWSLGNDVVINDAGKFEIEKTKAEVRIKKI